MKLNFKARCLVFAICVSLLCGVILLLRLTATEMILSLDQHNNQNMSPRPQNGDKLLKKLFGHLLQNRKSGLMSASYAPVGGESIHRNAQGDSDVERLSPDKDQLPDYNVHVFYYMWYGSPKFDGEYLHWNHPYLPHWNQIEDKKWPKGRHKPPEDVGSSFYPALGVYSSQDPVVLDTHMQQIRLSGAGVVAVSWYPPGMSDDNGRPVDPHIPLLLDAANNYHLKVCFHIEPYKERNADNLRKYLAYIMTKYGNHPAFYRRQVGGGGRDLPVYYIYDSYLVPAEDWTLLLHGTSSLRHTELDAVFIGLLVESRHQAEILSSGFDGFYTYFASNGFTYGSTLHNWRALASFAAGNHLLFVPSVGPGYVDTAVRPWNGRSTRPRKEGAYYERSWQAAVDVHPPVISVTSFNEWHEGTQIEPASSQTAHGERNYLSYLPHQPDHYLKLTNKWVGLYRKLSNTRSRSLH